MRETGCYFDNEGNLHIPSNIPRPGKTNPDLNPRQWLLWVLLSAENKRNDYNKWLEKMGSRATHYRDRKKLVKLGYF